MTHYYAFSFEHGYTRPVYERTFGDLRRALRWTAESPLRFITTTLPRRYYY